MKHIWLVAGRQGCGRANAVSSGLSIRDGGRPARLRPSLVALLAALGGLIVAPAASAAPTTFSYTGPPVPIPDVQSVSVPIAVSGLSTSLSDVDFRIDGTSCSTDAGSTTVGIDHTFVGDLEIKLTSPAGRTVRVLAYVGGSGDNFCQVLLDDDAAGAASIQLAASNDAPFTGTWLPVNPLSAFDGQDPNGTWTVTAVDRFAGDVGTIRAVSIIIDDAPPAPTSLPAVVRASTGWLLRDSLSTGPATFSFSYGTRPLVPIMGDWDGNGTRTAGTYEAGVFKLNNANNASAPDITFTFGDRRGFPVSGDFDGDGTDDVAVYRNGLWQLRLSDGTVLPSFTYGSGSWPATIPVTGDWDGDGRDGIGTYTYSSATWALRNDASAGPADAGTFVFGVPNSSYPVPGDWDGDGSDTIGVKNAGSWLLRNTNSSGAADTRFEFGEPNDLPLTWTPSTSATEPSQRWQAVCEAYGGVFSRQGGADTPTYYCYGTYLAGGVRLTQAAYDALAPICAAAGGSLLTGVFGDDPYGDITCVVRR